MSFLAVTAAATVAQAGYDFQIVDYPGASSTDLWGINNQGQAVGHAFVGEVGLSFAYDAKKQAFSALAPPDGYFIQSGGINERATIVGNVFNTPEASRAFILNKGTYTFFAKDRYAYTQARATCPAALS
jgi:hypothetical protein